MTSDKKKYVSCWCKFSGWVTCFECFCLCQIYKTYLITSLLSYLIFRWVRLPIIGLREGFLSKYIYVLCVFMNQGTCYEVTTVNGLRIWTLILSTNQCHAELVLEKTKLYLLFLYHFSARKACNCQVASLPRGMWGKTEMFLIWWNLYNQQIKNFQCNQ